MEVHNTAPTRSDRQCKTNPKMQRDGYELRRPRETFNGGTPDRDPSRKKKEMLVCVLVLFSVHDVAMINVRRGKILEYFSIAKSQEKMVV
jgi:hypothetical protein